MFLAWVLLLAPGQAPACAALPQASMERGACHGKLRQWAEAERAYGAYLSAVGDSVPAALARVDALLRLQEASLEAQNTQAAVGYAVEASRQLARVAEAHPGDPAVLKAQASLFAGIEKNPGAAEQALLRATRAAPRDAEAWGLLGSFYLDAERTEEGIGAFERAASLEPANPLFRAGLGRGYAKAGREADAAQAFSAAVKAARPDSAPAIFLWYGDFLSSSERYDESRQAYTRVLEAAPGNAEALLKRAGVELKMGRPREAERDALAALERGAGRRDAQTLLVRIYGQLGEEGKASAAASALERASEAEEERRAKWRDAKNALEQADRDMQANRFSEALPLYTKVTADLPEYPEAWFALGVCQMQTGNAAGAEQALRTYVRLQPQSAEGRTALGLLLFSLRRVEDARAELKEALRLDPGSAEAKEALAALEGQTRPR